MQALIDAIRLHGTKMLGFAGITLSALATADPALVGGDKAIKYYLLGISLLNVWRGFFTSDAFKVGLVVKQENAAKADAIIRDSKQGGFVRISVLCIFMSMAVFAALSLTGCVDTQEAYKAAPLHGEAVSDTAYVIAEHYAAVVKEAADLRESGHVSSPIIAAMQEADRRAKPIILGDATQGIIGLRQLSGLYTSTHEAKTEAELQAAVNSAAIALADLINAVKSARGK